MRNIKTIVLTCFIAIVYDTLQAQSSKQQLYGFNRYVEVLETNGTQSLDIIRTLSDSSITLFISNKTIQVNQIHKIVLVKNKTLTFMDTETGAGLGFYLGSMFTPAVDFEPVNEISDYIPPLAGMLAGAVAGGSSINKKKKRKFKIQGDQELYKELIPELRFYQYNSPVSFYAY